MSSSNSVKIDWSRPIENPYVQIDAYTKTPVDDLYNYKLTSHTPNILTTEYILSTDIDIYIKFNKKYSQPTEIISSNASTYDENIVSSSSNSTVISPDNIEPKKNILDEDTPVDNNDIFSLNSTMGLPATQKNFPFQTA
ncbi:unnamed protein product [Rhizophagus irregularis]|nr:unnamed protein product [Rhizophagus irregularis]